MTHLLKECELNRQINSADVILGLVGYSRHRKQLSLSIQGFL